MPFIWTAPMSAGEIVYDVCLEEIHHYIDHMVDYTTCSTHNAQVFSTYDTSYEVSNKDGENINENTSENASQDLSVDSTEYVSDLGSNYENNLITNNVGDLSSYNANDCPGYNSPVGNDYGISCPSHYTSKNDVHNVNTGWPIFPPGCGPGGNFCACNIPNEARDEQGNLVWRCDVVWGSNYIGPGGF